MPRKLILILALVVSVLCLVGAAWAADNPGADPNEKPGEQGRPAWVRFFIGTDGMGVVNCNTCYTSGGCESLWIQVGYPASCHAKPAPGYKFSHWTSNGNFTSNKPNITFGGKGAKLVGHFVQ